MGDKRKSIELIERYYTSSNQFNAFPLPLAVGAAGFLLSIIYVLAAGNLGSPQAVAIVIWLSG